MPSLNKPLTMDLARCDYVDRRANIIITSNLPFDEWTEVFGSERLTGALLGRLTHHVHILEMNGESYRLKHSRNKQKQSKPNPDQNNVGPWANMRFGTRQLDDKHSRQSTRQTITQWTVLRRDLVPFHSAIDS